MRVGPDTRFDHPRDAEFKIVPPSNNLPLVFVTEEVLHAIVEHAAEGFPLEIGGYCLGLPLVDHLLNANATFIQEVVRAITTSTRTHVTMHPETFLALEQRRAPTDTLLVGYYHSHPGHGVFQSIEDIYNFQSYHTEDYQIAIVADPSLVGSTALLPYGWIGFFAWDAVHTPIMLPPENLLVSESEGSLFALLSRPGSSAEETKQAPNQNV
jgi:proteasome lid subunit RPN8/RPN11